MNFSRRQFLSGAAGSAATLWSLSPAVLAAQGVQPEGGFACSLLDLHSHCVLRESLQGYLAALSGEHRLIHEADLGLQRGFRMVLVPALGLMNSDVARTLSDLLEAGTHVLLESGAGFLNPREFYVHQSTLRRYFGIEIGTPVDLWVEHSGDDALRSCRSGRLVSTKNNVHAADPYVNYVWPRAIKVRDFSRAIPVSANGAEVIGKVGKLAVALKKQSAKGTLIFLGSPLGPALQAGDAEALAWLRSVTTHRSSVQGVLT
jgi:hypothetical protein